VGTVKKVVIDTNVFVSGFGWDGKPEAILQLLQQGRIHNFISDAIFEELKTVVSYPKMGFSETLQHAILAFAFFYSRLVVPSSPLSVIKSDPADNKFIEAALAAGADSIISGDRHLLSLGHYKKITIMNPTAFLAVQKA